MLIKMLDTVEEAYSSPADEVVRPTIDGADVQPCNEGTRKGVNTSHYRLVAGETYNAPDDMADALIEGGFAEAA